MTEREKLLRDALGVLSDHINSGCMTLRISNGDVPSLAYHDGERFDIARGPASVARELAKLEVKA